MKVCLKILDSVIEKELKELHGEGVKLRHIGRLDKLPSELRRKVENAIELTKDNDKLTIVLAFNYGGRDEIVYAVEQLIKSGVKADDVSETLISQNLFTAGIPDPDLIIRTSGEMRLSNFLIWQAAYSEYYVTPTYWPDFDKAELQKAIDAFCQRNRRFGCLDDNDK